MKKVLHFRFPLVSLHGTAAAVPETKRVVGLHSDTFRKADGTKGSKDGRTSGADKGQGNADDGRNPDAHSYVHDSLHGKHGGKSEADQFPSIVFGTFCTASQKENQKGD